MATFPKKLFVKEIVDGNCKYFEAHGRAAELGEFHENIEGAEYQFVRKIRVINKTDWVIEP